MATHSDINRPASFVEFFKQQPVLSSFHDKFIPTGKKKITIGFAPGGIKEGLWCFHQEGNSICPVADFPVG